MKIKFRFNSDLIKEVEVNPNDNINILLNKLDINDRNIKFLFHGKIFSTNSNEKFSDIGITNDTEVAVINQFLNYEEDIELTLIVSKNKKYIVKVNIDEPISNLIEKIPTLSKKERFIYNGCTYNFATVFTFREIELIQPTTLILVTPSRAGKVL